MNNARNQFATLILSVFLLAMNAPVPAAEATPEAQAPEAPKALLLGDREFRIDRDVKRHTYDLTWPVHVLTEGDPKDRRLSFAFAAIDPDTCYRVDLSASGWRLVRRLAAREHTLDSGDMPLDPGTAWGAFTLKRRRRLIAATLGGRLLFRALDSGPGKGLAASWSDPPGQAGAVTYQGISEADMVFGDDFMRTPEEKAEGVWEVVSGQWKLQSSADEWRGSSPLDPTNTARNPNPFVYRGTGAPHALAVAGQPFWDDIAASVSVRSQGGRAGWVFGYQGAEDHYVLWWEPTSRWEVPSRLAIERVRSGETTVLAEAKVTGQTEQWYRIGIEIHGPVINALLHDSRILQVTDTTFAGGRFGMCTTDGEVDFDDIVVHASRRRPLEEAWVKRRALQQPQSAWTWTRRGARCRLPRRSDDAWLFIGERAWKSDRLTVTVRTPPRGISQIGICYGAPGPDRALFLWDSDSAWRPKRRWVRGAAFGGTAMAQARGGYAPGRPLRLTVDVSDGALQVHEANIGLLLRSRAGAVKPGLLGLFVRGKGEFAFTDLVLEGEDERDWERPVKTSIFVADHYMLDWSAAEGQWVADASASTGMPRWWHKGDFFGAVELGLPLAALSQPSGANVYLLAGEHDPSSGYDLSLASLPRQTGTLRATLRWRGRKIARADFSPPANTDSLRVHKDGAFLWLECGEAEPLSLQLRDHTLAGTRVGLGLPSEAVLEQVTLRRDHVVDDQFDRVTTNWHKLGRWEVSNKFHCDPRWAYLVGESEGLAALRHLDSFPGDLTLEFYAGMRYRAQNNFMPYYPRPGDINAVFSGTGRGVFDGYTAVVSGWSTTRTCLLRDGRELVSTERPLVPSTRRDYPRPQHLHRKWFYVKIRRVGGLLEMYFDNERVLSCRDPEPLLGSRLALWTLDNSMLIARVKIAYSRRERYKPVVIPATAEPVPPVTPGPEAGPVVHLASGTHPGCRFTFAPPGRLQGWQETGDVDHARVTWDPQGATGQDGSVRATNANPGGQFLLPVPAKGLDLRRALRLRFACRLEPGVRVNLYAKLAGKWHFVRLTGPGESDENLVCLGQATVQDDGTWQRVDIPLGETLLGLYPTEKQLPVEQLEFGVHRGGYLLAGLDGNPAGVSFSIDDFEIASVGTGEFAATLMDASGAAVQEGTVTVRRDDGTVVADAQPFSGGTIALKLEDGAYVVSASGKGESEGDASLRLHVATAPVSVTEVLPAEGTPWGSEPIAVRLETAGLAPLWDLSLTVAGKAYVVDDQALTYDRRRRSLRFDPAAAGLALTNGKPCHFVLKELGGGARTIKEWDLVYDQTADKVPPSAPKLGQYVLCDTFEHDKGTWARTGPDKQGRDHSAMLIRDRARAANGRYSLKLFNELIGGTAGAQISTQSLHAGKHPLVSFDCLMEREVLADLLLVARGMECRITLTDNGHRNTAYRLGSLTPPFEPNGTWHHLEVNWHDLLAATPWVPNLFAVSNLRIGDGGWTGNPEGAAYWIDNLEVSPCLSSAGAGLALSWSATDPGGVAAYSYHWSPQPREDADTEPEGATTTATFKDLPEGRGYFHIRAADAAGNWGETSDWLVLVDNTPPSVARFIPEPDSIAGGYTLGVELADGISGIDPDSLTLTVNGRAFKPGQPGVDLDLATGLFTVDWVKTKLAPTPPPAGHVFEGALAAVRDFAGNTAEATTWKWTFATQEDKRPPLAPEVTWSAGSVLQRLTFESETPVLSVAAPFRLDRAVDGDEGTTVQRIRCEGTGTILQVVLAAKVDAATHRYLSFRYRFPANLKIDLGAYATHPEAEKRHMIMKLTDADVRPDYVVHAGAVEGIARDDRWHTALVDMKRHMELREELGDGAPAGDFQLTSVALLDVGFNWQEPGTTFFLDDVTVFAGGPAAATFALSATDESGVAGFACSFDRDPAAAPKQEVNVQPGATYAVTFPDKGTWYVHATARDNAGNWSRPGHLVYVVE